MSNNKISENRFDPKRTKTVIIHDGRFHADDMMFAAMAQVAAEKFRNKIEIIRTSDLPTEYSPNIVVGDVGLGVYDHHTSIDGVQSIGSANDNEQHVASACGLLYRDIKDILFPGSSETKSVFEALIDIIEHCDNTPDNNTFSDSVNYLSPADDANIDASAMRAISYCRDVLLGFIESHKKECGGKTWAVPRICSGIVPGTPEKKDVRYWKASNQIKSRYKYISFNNTTEIKLRSIDTYSLCSGAMTQNKRQYWRKEIEDCDLIQVKEMERREQEEWPKALSEMQNLTIVLDKYLPYGQFVKDIPALFIILPSQRGGYTVNFVKTNNGKYRFDPEMFKQYDQCKFIANDMRFVFFETREAAITAAREMGTVAEKYIKDMGFDAYRKMYGGCYDGYNNNFFQDLIGEDIALNLYAKSIIKDLTKMTVEEVRMLQIAIVDNPYLIHSFCSRFDSDGEFMAWNTNISVVEIQNLSQETLLTKTKSGLRWDFGLRGFLTSENGAKTLLAVYPQR